MKSIDKILNKNQSIKAYAAMGAAFLAVTPQEAEAQIVHADPPDITLEIDVVAGGGGFSVNAFLDLDGQQLVTSYDPAGDIGFQALAIPESTAGSSWATARNFAFGLNGAIVSNTYGGISFYGVAKLDQGANVGAGPGFSAYPANGGVLYNHRYATSFGGTFRSTGNFKPHSTDVEGYLGVQFLINGDTHYGWVRVTSNVNGGPPFDDIHAYLTVHEWAYNSVPNEPIPIPLPAPVEPIPTLSEWGLITLSLIVLSFGTVLIGRREEVVAGQATGDLKIKSQFQRPPFFAAYFKKALIGTAMLAAIMAVFSQVVYGGITAVDFFGTMVAGPIFAYLMHLVTAYNDRFKAERDSK